MDPNRKINMLTSFRRRSKDSGPPRVTPQAPPKGLDYLRSSQHRPASSVYSQSSPLTTQFAPQVTSVNARYRVADDNNVSPPSSPEVLTPRDAYRESPDISPIEEVPDMSQSDTNAPNRPGPRTQPRSNIPMMRRERRKNQEQAATTLRDPSSREGLGDQPQGARQHHNPRWDPMTGELTSGSSGRPSQVAKPVEYAHGLGITQNDRNPNLNSFTDRMRRNPGAQSRKVSGPEVVLAERPPWNGASGRTTLVAPVNDNTNVAPLRVPPKSVRRVPHPAENSPFGTASPPVSPETVGLGAPTRSRDGKSRTPEAGPRSHATQDTLAYPSPPNSGSPLNAVDPGSRDPFTTSKSPATTTTTTPPPHHPPPSQHDIPTGTDDSPSIKRQQRQLEPPRHVPHESWSSSVYSQATEVAPPVPLPTATTAVVPEPVPTDPWTQPPSRFSVTTYATSVHESPRPSADLDSAPPIPAPPSQFTSVLDRSRPKIGGESIGAKPTMDKNVLADPIVISMKAPAFVASPTRTGPLRSNPVLHPVRSHTWDIEGKSSKGSSNMAKEVLMSGALGRANSTSPTGPTFRRTSIASVSTNKELPPAPPEIEENSKGDRVGILNARLSALGNRRININRSIKQMTELMPTDNLLASKAVLAKREEEKRKVEALKMELAEVQREEYELGLKLHRAYKRMDKNENFERSTLWVRRVTDA